MYRLFFDAAFRGDISNWDVSSVTNMSAVFNSTINDVNFDLSKWDVSSVTDMSGLFWATDFNGDISSWDVSNVKNMNETFGNASSFNQDIKSWNVSNVEDMGSMFVNTSSFNQDLSSWDVSNVTNMNRMFSYALVFNQDLSKWCVTNISSEPTDFSTSSELTEANKPIWGTCPGNSYTIAVTASSNADYTLSGEDRNGDVSGNDPNLTFKVGDEVTFSVNAANHPFYLKTTAGTGTGNQISGVTNNGTTNGNIVWTPTEAGTYYYQCSAHSGMVGTITIE
jgi:surface protein